MTEPTTRKRRLMGFKEFVRRTGGLGHTGNSATKSQKGYEGASSGGSATATKGASRGRSVSVTG